MVEWVGDNLWVLWLTLTVVFAVVEVFILDLVFLMLAAGAKVYLARHAVNLFAHFVEGRIDALTLCFDIFGNGMFDPHIRLMKNCYSSSGTFD